MRLTLPFFQQYLYRFQQYCHFANFTVRRTANLPIPFCHAANFFELSSLTAFVSTRLVYGCLYFVRTIYRHNVPVLPRVLLAKKYSHKSTLCTPVSSTHLSRMEFPFLINWTKPFLILELLGGFFLQILIEHSTSIRCRHSYDTHVIWLTSVLGLHFLTVSN